MDAETITDRFERLAGEFYRETRMMAPGKDQPAAMGGPSYEERVDRWIDWCNARSAAALAPTGGDDK